MFLAFSRSHLRSCAKGHVPRISVGTATRYTHVRDCKGSPPVCRHTIQLTTARTEIKTLQRSKAKFSSPCPRPECVHFFVEQVVEPAFPTSLPFINKLTARTNKTPVNRPTVNISNYQIHTLSRILTDGVSIGLHSRLKGYCTAPGKPVKEDQKNQETNQCESSSSSPPSNEVQFKELYENPWTIPNILCMARIVLSPVLGYLIMEQYFHASLGLFALAGATDVLDGYIARNWPNQKSALGSALDPLADKILVSVLYISLTYAQLIPVPLTALVIARDVALIAAVFYVRYKTVPPPVTLSKFFNPCYTTAQLKPTLISKFNTAIQLILVAVSLASPIFHYTDSVFLQSLWYVTALTTVASGYSYYHYGRKTVEVLNKRK
ncbi:cardiolipin synthase (CMP-forming) [Ictalurus punctatus]|uniref:Cardiolipin synthase (CMP-forming) n=1 Tax=Ictalurus punctatus TaxID=7998 RepID=A0A2D0RPV1_ICTPU|nr:cardiolipin synthase (CMP-forming) [Ictalurus punctatus]